MTERNASLQFSGDSDNNHSDSPLLVEEEGRFCISDEICFL
jgi:hypothetical protein